MRRASCPPLAVLFRFQPSCCVGFALIHVYHVQEIALSDLGCMIGNISLRSRPLRGHAVFQFCWSSVLAVPTETSDTQNICSPFMTSRHRARRSCRALGSSWQAHKGVPSLNVEEHELCRLNTVAISTSTMLSATLRKRCADVVPSRAPATAAHQQSLCM